MPSLIIFFFPKKNGSVVQTPIGLEALRSGEIHTVDTRISVHGIIHGYLDWSAPVILPALWCAAHIIRDIDINIKPVITETVSLAKDEAGCWNEPPHAPAVARDTLGVGDHAMISVHRKCGFVDGEQG
ncbi:hypothetical protein SFRURICE_017296 [Spodoptera frugiperda]|nr:hypothetical protein SFRURICE_017296 [Spodoptera frugiperda]